MANCLRIQEDNEEIKKNYDFIANCFVEHYKKYSDKKFPDCMSEPFDPLNPETKETLLQRNLTYLFLKGAEFYVVWQLYSKVQNRPGAFDCFCRPDEIIMEFPRTNLPVHLEKEIHGLKDDARQYATELSEEAGAELLSEEKLKDLFYQAMSKGGELGADKGLSTVLSCGYRNDLLFTANEVRAVAMNRFLQNLKEQGFSVAKATVTRETWYQIHGRNPENQPYYILFDARVYPEKPGFSMEEISVFRSGVQRAKGQGYLAQVILRSGNPDHFRDGVILWGDPAMIRVDLFEKLQGSSGFML